MNAAPPRKEFKLEIGSGENPQKGYLHFDCRTGLPGLDVAGDILHLPFREGSVTEILSHSSIEHISWRKIGVTLADWFRVLAPGGRAIIYTPDFNYLCRMYLEGRTDPHLDKRYIDDAREIFGGYSPASWALMKMFAGQEYPENFHCACYDFDGLRAVLESAGFRNVTRIPPDYSLRVVAYKPPALLTVAAPVRRPVPVAPPAPAAAPSIPVHRSKRVHVNLVDRGWILERMGRELGNRLDYVSVGDGPRNDAQINYHINYHAFRQKSAFDMALFTHREENAPGGADLFVHAARQADFCVCMSKTYERLLRENNIDRITTIMPGIELDKFTPELRIGVAGRTYATGRKGEALVAKAMAIPLTRWYFCGEGWPAGGVTMGYDRLSEFYRLIDVLLVPSRYEGGPMPVLEALASGKEVLSPPVGFVPEFPHIEYEAGNFDELRNRIEELLRNKLRLRASVEQRTWHAWALEHHTLFTKLLPPTMSVAVAGPARPAVPVPVVIAAATKPLESLPSGASAATRTPKKGGLRILLVARKEAITGGPSIRIPILAGLLEAAGHTVEISYDPAPVAAGFDVAHVFNVWAPWEALPQMRHLKSTGIPLVLSPIFLDLAESAWAGRASMLIFAPTNTAETRAKYLDALADGSLMLDNRSRHRGMDIFPNAAAVLREIVTLADHLITLSTEEMQRISRRLDISRMPFTVVHNAAEYSLFGHTSPNPFVTRFGVRDFVLCVGRIERRKNQAMLLQALRDSRLPVVLVGRAGEPDYEAVCRSLAKPDTLFIPQLDRSELASAYAAARVVALPSWAEGASLANIEAAASGCPLVVSNRSSEFEYFGDAVRYCDPASCRSIGKAVHEAWDSYEPERPIREALRKRLEAGFTWELAAENTIQAYERVIDNKIRLK